MDNLKEIVCKQATTPVLSFPIGRVHLRMLRSILILTCSICAYIDAGLAQDSASIALDAYLSKTGSRQIWESTVGLRTEGTYAELNGGFHYTAEMGLPKQFIFVQYRDGSMVMTSKTAEAGAVVNKQCIFEGQFSFMQLRNTDTLSHVSNSYSMFEAQRIYGKFCPQLFVVSITEGLKPQYAGEENVGEEIFWVLAFEEEEKSTYWYINQETGFLHMMGDYASGNYTLLSDYHEVDGRWLAFQEQTYRNRLLIYNKIVQRASFEIGKVECKDVFFTQ